MNRVSIVVAVMAIFVVMAIVREVLMSIIKKKKVIAFGNLDLIQTVLNYIDIIFLPIFCIIYICNPIPIPGWLVVALIVLVLLYIISIVAQLSEKIIKL